MKQELLGICGGLEIYCQPYSSSEFIPSVSLSEHLVLLYVFQCRITAEYIKITVWFAIHLIALHAIGNFYFEAATASIFAHIQFGLTNVRITP